MKELLTRSGLIIAVGFFASACMRMEMPPDSMMEKEPKEAMMVEEAPSEPEIRPGTMQEFIVNVGDRVYFATANSELDAGAQRALDRQAVWMLENYDTTAQIEGHTDSRGTRDLNLALGQQRANAVRNYLQSRGISAARLQIVSYGKERPEESCEEERCWKLNRRTVTVISGAPTI